MQINSGDPKTKTVIDWDFVLKEKIPTQVTVDSEAGDRVERSSFSIIFYLAEKPSPVDPDVTLLATEVEVVNENVLVINRTPRIVTELTHEQKVDWKRSLQARTKPSNPFVAKSS